MKTSVKVISLALALVTLVCVFASCGTKLSGTYSAEAFGTGVSYEFKGSKVTVSFKLLGQSESIEGTYKIKDDEITFTFDSDDKEAKEYSGTFDFEKGDDYIKIEGVKYTKD